jgi:hypothetical protein
VADNASIKAAGLLKAMAERAVAMRAQQSTRMPSAPIAQMAATPPPAAPPPVNPQIQRIQQLMMGNAQPQVGGHLSAPPVSRADMMAQNNPLYAQEEPFPEPPPNSDLTPEEWADTDPEFRARVWEAYDGSQMITKPQQILPGMTPSSPAFGEMIAQQQNPSAVPDDPARTDAAAIQRQRAEEGRIKLWRDANALRQQQGLPPIDPQGFIYPEEKWRVMTPELKAQAFTQLAEGPVDLDEYANADQGWGTPETLERIIPSRAEIGQSLTNTPVYPGGPTINDIRENPISETVKEHVVEPFLNLINKPLQWNMEQQADATYYMLTHNGEMPSDWGDWGTYSARLFGGNALVPDELEPIDFLMNATAQQKAEAVRAYEQGYGGKTGAEGMIAWYYDTIGPWWSFAAQTANDPLNWTLLLGIPASQLRRTAAYRSTNLGPEAGQGSGLLRTAEALKFASDPLSYPIEKIIDKIPKWRGLEGERAAAQTAKETAQASEETATDLLTGNPEAQANARREAAAQENIARQTAEADVVARNEQAAAERTRLAEETRARQNAAKAEADRARAQRAYEADLKKAEVRHDAAMGRAANAKARKNAALTFKQRQDEARIKFEAAQANIDAKYGNVEQARVEAEAAAPTGRTAQDVFDDTIGLNDPLPPNAQRAWDEHRDILADRARTEREIPVQDVPANARIVATQGDLLPERLQEYVDNPNLASDTADLPIAIKDGDTYYVIEGHHRTGGARIRGDATIPMRVIDATPAGAADTAVASTPPPRPMDNYYGPQYVAKSGQPNLANLVENVYGPRNPEAARQFWDNYMPLADQQVARDKRLAAAQADQGVPAGIERDTPERVINEVEFKVQSDALFEVHFGERPPPRTYRKYDSAGRMDPNDPRSWIEHAVFGDSPADAAAAIARIRNHPTPILDGHTNDEIVEWATDRARLTQGELPEPEIATPAPTPEPPTGVSPLPDEIRTRILDPDPEVSKAARAEAYRTPGVNRKEVEALREQAGHPKTPRKRKPRGTVGIVNDPFEASAPFAEATRHGIGQATAVVRPWKPAPAKAVGKITVPGHVKYADELAEASERNVGITQRQIDEMTAETSITIGTGKNARTITTNYWDRMREHMDDLATRRKKQLREDGYPKTPEGQQAYYDELNRLEKDAIAKTNEDFASTWDVKKQQGVSKVVSRQMAGLRGRLQFNAVTGVRNLLVDYVSNQWRRVLHGESLALRENGKTFATLLTKNVDEFDAWNQLPIFDRLRKAGIKHLPKDIQPTIGREEIERVLSTGKGKWNPLENYVIKKARSVNDTATRYTIYSTHFNRNLIFEQAKWLDFVRGKVAKGADQQIFTDLRSLAQKGDFSPDDVRAITTKYGADDSYARTWAKQVDDLQMRAHRAQQKVMFTYKKTKIDDALGKVFLFHYFMTRQSADYVRLMLQHPQLIAYEDRLWDMREDLMEAFPGLPDWMQYGFLPFAKSNGHALFTNPMMMFSGLTAFSQIGEQGFNQSKLEGLLNQTGLFLNPMWQAAAAITGYFGMRDPTGTRQLERWVTASYDWIRFSDWGREHGLAQSGDLPMRQWIQDTVNGIANAANEKAREALPWLKDFDDVTSEESQREAIEGILITNAEEEGWTDERLMEAQNDLYAGNANPDIDDAVNEYADIQHDTAMGNMIVPGGVYERDVATDERKKRQREAESGTPDAETRQAEQLRSGEALTLHQGLEEYGQKSPLEEHLNAGRTQMLYEYEEVPDDWILEMPGGRTVTGAELKAMTDEEREALYDEWSHNQNVPQGATPTGEALYAYDTRRENMRKADPMLEDVDAYRDYLREQEDAGTVGQFRQDLLAAGDNTEFAQAHAEQEAFLREQGYEDEELQAELDGWMTGESAYAALMGWQYRSRRSPGAAMFSARDPAPWRQDASSVSGGEPETESAFDTGQAIDEGTDLATVDARDVRGLIRDDAISDEALRVLVKEGTITEADVRAWQRDGTLLDENIYVMAAKPNLTATDIKYMVEDGYLTIRQARDLIFTEDENEIAKIRRLNRQRKSDKENKVGPYAPKDKKSSSTYYPSMMQDFLLK